MSKKRIVALFLAVIFTSLVFLAGCGGQPAPKAEEKKPAEQPKAEDTIKIGVVAPLTGDVATFGQSTKNAVLLAAKEWNAKGGLLGKKIDIRVEDDKNVPEETASAFKKLITNDKVVGIIGSVASKCSLAGAPIANENKVPMVTPTSTNEKVTAVGEYIFRACFIDPFQGKVMAKFAAENLKAKTAAVLYDIGNDYTKGLAENFKASFENDFKGKIVQFLTYSQGDQDFKAQLTKIKSANPDVLFLPDYYNTVGLIAKQARDLGIKATFLGGDGWDSPDLVKIGGKAVEGGYFSNHYSPEAKNPEAVAFIEAYKKEYGSVPDALAALAYDAANLLFNAIKTAGKTDGAAVKTALAATKDFKAVSGSITFDANRNPVKSAAIITIKDGKQAFVTTVNP